MTPAPARTHRRTTARTHIPRRVSGPVSRRMVAAPAGATALPRRGSTGLFARVRALPEHRVIDRLLRSRLWIWALGLALGGIVTMQVSLLKLNSGISRAVETTATLERQNAALEAEIARLSAPDRIATGAKALGMDMPAAGSVAYLRAGEHDAERAVERMQPPSEEARGLLANGGIVPGSLAAPVDAAASGVAPETTIATSPVPPAPTPTPTPAPVETPAATTPTPTTTQTTSPTGGAVAGQG